MVPNLSRWLVPAALCSFILGAYAQSASSANGRPAQTLRLDPLDANARVPTLSYESPFARYRRLGDDKLIPWREANDTVSRIGGWRVYAREAQQPDSAAPSGAGTAAPQSVPQGHSGHKTP